MEGKVKTTQEVIEEAIKRIRGIAALYRNRALSAKRAYDEDYYNAFANGLEEAETTLQSIFSRKTKEDYDET